MLNEVLYEVFFTREIILRYHIFCDEYVEEEEKMPA